ncbi:hypothetical protein ScPMuIL_002626 [Solemya velum]
MSDYHSTSRQSSQHGKIVTENSSLLRLLRDKSKESIRSHPRSQASILSQHNRNPSDVLIDHAYQHESSSDEELALDLNALQHSSASDIRSNTQLDSGHSLFSPANHLNEQSTYRLNANTSRTIPHIDSSGFRDEQGEGAVTPDSDHSIVDTPVEDNQNRIEDEVESRNSFIPSSVKSRNSLLQATGSVNQIKSVNNSAKDQRNTNTPRLLSSQGGGSANNSLRSSSSVYAVANPAVLEAQGFSPPSQPVQFTPRSEQSRQLSQAGRQFSQASHLTGKSHSIVSQPSKQNSLLSQPGSGNTNRGRQSVVRDFSGSTQHRNRRVTIDPQLDGDLSNELGPNWDDLPDCRNRPPTPYEQDIASSTESAAFLGESLRATSIPDWNTPRVSPSSKQHKTPTEQTLNLREDSRSQIQESRQSGLSSRPSERSEKLTVESDTTPTPVYQNGSIVHIHHTPRARESQSPEPVATQLQETFAPAAKTVGPQGMTHPRPTVKRVYIESPTFTKDEEEEYRFVSSRLDDIENEFGDKQDTFRRLEEMDSKYQDRKPIASGSPLKQTRKVNSLGKKMDDGFPNGDRYEDMNQEMNAQPVLRSGHSDVKNTNTSTRYEARDNLQQTKDNGNIETAVTGKFVSQSGGGDNTESDELKREAEYQMFLKERIKTHTKQAEDFDVPGVPKLQEVEDHRADEITGKDFAQDSLDFSQFQRQNNGYIERDSLEFDENVPQHSDGPQNALVLRNDIPQYGDWRNPPPNPFGSRTSLQSDQNPRWQQKFPPDFVDDNDAARMELLHPVEPKINFVETNKFDYGKPQDKSYQKINERRREDEHNLENIFIKPKVSKPKVPKSLYKGSRSEAASHLTSPMLDESLPMNYKPTSAEELWAKRSNFLSKKKDSKLNSGKSKANSVKSSGSMRKAYSGGNLHSGHNETPPFLKAGSPRLQSLDPLQEHPMLPLPPPVSQQERRESPALQMQPVYRKPLELKPITQEIFTEDGQRISVDINLKVVSPPPGQQYLQPGQIGNQVVQMDSDGGPRPIGLQYQQYGPPFEQVNQYEQQPVPYYQDNQDPYMYHNTDAGGGIYSQNGQGAGTYQLENGQIDRYDYSRPLDDQDYSTNPYSKVPPILTADESTEISEITNGYAARYKKEKSKDPNAGPTYKVYSLEDYRRMKKECELGRGKLGPDFENLTYKQKLDIRRKQLEYARNVMDKNKQELAHTGAPKRHSPSVKTKEQKLENTRRKAALDYSKTIAKPVGKPQPNQYNSYEVAAQLSPTAKTGNLRSPKSGNSVDVIDLQKLQQRHEQEKQNVAMIRQNMSGPVLQKA